MSKEKTKKSGGYTLIELLVVVVIMAVITGIMMSGRSSFNGGIALNNLAYDIALAIRQAQSYATNVRPTTSNIFSGTFGVSFRFAGYTTRFVPSTTSFILFQDTNGDREYESNSTEFLREYKLQNGNRIAALCVETGAVFYCDASVPNGYVDITFQRPDTEACINPGVNLPPIPPATKTPTAQCQARSTYTGARITIQSANGKTKTIRITNIGQITVN